MPASTVDWIFAISILAVGFLLGIVANLLTPLIKRRGEGRIAKWRREGEEYREGLKYLSERLKREPNLAIVVLGGDFLYGITIAMAGGFVLVVSMITYFGFESIDIIRAIASVLMLVGVFAFSYG
jgi:hypothetical protein